MPPGGGSNSLAPAVGRAEDAIDATASSAPATPGEAAAARAATADEPGLDQGLSEAEARRVDLLWAGGLTALILLAIASVHWAPTAAMPVLVSAALAHGLDPLIDWLEKRRLSRTAAIGLLFLVCGAALAGFLLYLVPALGRETAKVPGFVGDIASKALPRLEGALGFQLPQNVRDAMARLSESGGSLAQKALPSVASLVGDALGSTASLLLGALALLIIPVLTFYLLRDFDLIVARIRDLIPRRYERLVAGRFAEVDATLSSFLRGQLIVGGLLTIIYSVGLSLAGLDLAVVIGAVAGFGTMIPYVGPAIGIGLAVLSLAVSWQGPWQLGVVAASFGIGMTAEGLYLTPRIVGGRVGLSALSVMLAVLVFGQLMGLLGVLLAVPVTACLKVVIKVVVFRYRRTATYRGNA